MNNIIDNIEDVLTEWAVNVDNGTPDVKNKKHLIVLERVLFDMGFKAGDIFFGLERLSGLTEATYVDNYKNRRLNRVGKEWGTGGKQEPKKKEEPETDTEEDISIDVTIKIKRIKGMSSENINSIDGTAKENFFLPSDHKDKTTAPGTTSSAINEIGTGYGMSILNENPKITNEELSEAIKQSIKDVGGPTLSAKHLKSIANSSRREVQRAHNIMADEKMNPKETTVSHVWGSKDSLENTINTLKGLRPKVTEVNGIPLEDKKDKDGNIIEKGYESIIREGGAGENPTDTMVVMVDNSKKPPKVIILHTSNKMTSADIQANSTPIKSISIMMDKVGSANNSKATKRVYDANKFIKSKQKEMKKMVGAQADKFAKHATDPEIADKMIDALESGEKPFESANKYLIGTKSNASAGIRSDKAVKEFLEEKGWGESREEAKKWTSKQKREIMAVYAAEVKRKMDEGEDLGERDSNILARMYNEEKRYTGKEPDPETAYSNDDLNKLYQDQFEEMNKMRKDLNDIESGLGDKLYKEEFISRLHLDVAEGHSPGGIPNKYFELNQGRNESDIRYDDNGKMYIKEGSKYVEIDPKTGKKKKDGLTKSRNKVKAGNIATVASAEIIADCLGMKNAKKGDIAKSMSVGELTYKKDKDGNIIGKTGTAIIYSMRSGKKVKVGIQVMRSKSGIAGNAADTLEWDKEMQNCMQRKSHNRAKGIK